MADFKIEDEELEEEEIDSKTFYFFEEKELKIY